MKLAPKAIFAALAMIFAFAGEARAQYDLQSLKVQVKEVYLDRREVFDSTFKDGDWFFAAPLANALHAKTKEFVVSDELLFLPREETTVSLLEETERNLRATGLFSRVRISLDSADVDTYNVTVLTQDKWSTRPALLFGSSNGSERYGFRIEELNLGGLGVQLLAEGLYRHENEIGWQGTAELNYKRILRSELGLYLKLTSNKYKTEQDITIEDRYLSLADENAFGAKFKNYYGRDFIFYDKNKFLFNSFDEQKYSAWYSHAWVKRDKIFMTGLVELSSDERGRGGQPIDSIRAYDNCGRVLLGFSSSSEQYVKVTNINTYQEEDLATGGYGAATIGKVFSLGGKGSNLYYISGQAERSYFASGLYLFGQITGASAFARTGGQYTYQEFLGLGFYKFAEEALVAVRVREQATWNWYAKRQLILDSDFGLRGFAPNSFMGDNRMLANAEFRFFPDWKIWITKLSMVAFYDGGTVWNQRFDVMKTRWFTSIGLGLRIHDLKSNNSRGLFRIDFAYNATDGKFGGIVFTTNQLFSAFQNHPFRLPELFGLTFDNE